MTTQVGVYFDNLHAPPPGFRFGQFVGSPAALTLDDQRRWAEIVELCTWIDCLQLRHGQDHDAVLRDYNTFRGPQGRAHLRAEIKQLMIQAGAQPFIWLTPMAL
ncbi:hypothetical protein MMC15_003066 [Xylographa vitiligo]|nr:hypothetical protein [Xylographa vitiligo]